MQLGPNQAEIVTLPRPEHHAMFAQLHRFHVRVDRDMPGPSEDAFHPPLRPCAVVSVIRIPVFGANVRQRVPPGSLLLPKSSSNDLISASLCLGRNVPIVPKRFQRSTPTGILVVEFLEIRGTVAHEQLPLLLSLRIQYALASRRRPSH